MAEVERLWVPSTSDLLEKRQWKVDFFEDRTRQHYAYLTHEEDVLNAEALLKVRDINRALGSAHFQQLAVAVSHVISTT